MNNDTNTANNKYGHLLDKYLEPELLDWKIKQQREKEAKERYGNLLDKAKPDTSTLELMAKMENDQIERRKREGEERKVSALRRQEQIEAVKRREERHNAEVRDYAESIILNRENRRKEAERAEQEKREAEEEQQKMYDNISGLIRINPKTAEAYVQILKENGLI